MEPGWVNVDGGRIPLKRLRRSGSARTGVPDEPVSSGLRILMVGGGYTMALQSALFRGDVKLEARLVHDSRTSKLALSANMSRKFKLLSQRLTGLPSLETSYQD